MEEEKTESKSVIVRDYLNGTTNYRILAKKHDKSVKQIAFYLKNQKK